MKLLPLLLLLCGCTVTITVDGKPIEPVKVEAEMPDRWVVQELETYVDQEDWFKQLQRLAQSNWKVVKRYSDDNGYQKAIIRREFNAFRNQSRSIE